MRLVATALLLLPAFLDGCPATGDGYTSVANSGSSHGTHSASSSSTGRSTTASSSGSGTTGTGGSTSSAGSTGTSGETGGVQPSLCPPQQAPVLTDCASSQVELLTQVINFATELTVTSPVQLEDLNDLTDTITSGPEASLRICVDAGTTVAPFLQVTGYEPTIFGDIDLTFSECFDDIPLVPVDLWAEFTQSLAGYDSTKGAVAVLARTASGSSPCDLSGWTFWAFDPDGGSVAAETAYIVSTQLQSSTDGTSGTGAEVLYNIDPTLGVIRILGGQDGGGKQTGKAENCVNVGLAEAEYTGWVHIEAAQTAVSTLTFLVADGG